MIALTYTAIVLAAILAAMGDIMAHKHASSIFNKTGNFSFWGANSWVRKYKYNNPKAGRAFFGSTTFLVWLTDGWHLVKTLKWLLIFVAIMIGEVYYPIGSGHWSLTALEFVIMLVVYGGVFELFYTFILRRR
jgi:hypothetical protein